MDSAGNRVSSSSSSSTANGAARRDTRNGGGGGGSEGNGIGPAAASSASSASAASQGRQRWCFPQEHGAENWLYWIRETRLYSQEMMRSVLTSNFVDIGLHFMESSMLMLAYCEVPNSKSRSCPGFSNLNTFWIQLIMVKTLRGRELIWYFSWSLGAQKSWHKLLEDKVRYGDRSHEAEKKKKPTHSFIVQDINARVFEALSSQDSKRPNWWTIRKIASVECGDAE